MIASPEDSHAVITKRMLWSHLVIGKIQPVFFFLCTWDVKQDNRFFAIWSIILDVH
jgi:hypothetical protein